MLRCSSWEEARPGVVRHWAAWMLRYGEAVCEVVMPPCSRRLKHKKSSSFYT